MAKPAQFSITILGWDKFNPRKDVKNPSWFRLEHSMFENPEFYDFTHSELLVWVYLLSNASKKNSPTFLLSRAHAKVVGRFKEADIDSAIEKLEAIQCVHVDVTDTSRTRNADVTDAFATNETRRDERDITERDETPVSPGFAPPDLFDLWNQNRGPLPKAEKFTEKRKSLAKAQIKLYPEPDHWTRAIKKFTESKFCVETWKPGFDDLLSEAKRIKALEGRYDEKASGTSSGPKTREQQAMDHTRDQYERVLKGEL